MNLSSYLVAWDWQTTVSLLIVLIALGIFVRKLWKSVSGASSGCGTSCASCPASKPSSSNGLKLTKLVQLDHRQES